MKLFYNILTGFLFAVIVILQAAERIFAQCDTNRDDPVDVILRAIRYYLQYDSDEQQPAIGGGTY